MRKSLCLALLSGVALFAVGCGGAASTPTTGTAQQPTASIQPAETQTPTVLRSQPTATTVATSPIATASPPRWTPPTALIGTPIPGAQATLTAAPKLKTAVITLVNDAGEQSSMTVEVADTEPSRELGLMFRPSMDPDAGMLFDFNGDTSVGFWMKDTILPLSVAFIQADGTILDILDMKPLDLTGVNPSGPYHYALETNQGYFRAHNLQKGDKVVLPAAQGVVLPGMPNCAGGGTP